MGESSTSLGHRVLALRALAAAALALAVIAALSVPAAAGTRTGAPRPGAATSGAVRTASPEAPRQARVLSPLPETASTTTHYVYAEDGTSPDGIDVFKKSGSFFSFVQNVTVGAASGTYYGAHHLAVTKATTSRPPCLFFASDGDHQIYSFSIDPSTGKLTATAQGSVPAGTVRLDPADLLVVGHILIDTEPSESAFRTFAINADCSLTALMVNSTGGENDINIAVLQGHNIVSSDTNSGDIVTYLLNTTTGALTEISSVAGAASRPDSEAVQVKNTTSGTVINVFTGTVLVPPEAQAAQTDSNGLFLDQFSGSPATDGDSGAVNGIGVMVSGGLLLQLNENSNSVGWYTITPGTPGTPGSIAWASDTALGNGPTEMAKLGGVLFVAMWSAGVLDECHLGSSGVSGCVAAASLSTNGGTYENDGSVAIL